MSPLFLLITVFRGAYFPELRLGDTDRFSIVTGPFQADRVLVTYHQMRFYMYFISANRLEGDPSINPRA